MTVVESSGKSEDGDRHVEVRPSDATLAFRDIWSSVSNVRFWSTLAWVDIVQRYRGSLIGPFWLTLSTAALLLGLGPIYALLFQIELASYLPYVAAGLIVWNFIAATINESSSAFISAGGLMRQIYLPKTVHILHTVSRNIFIFFHTIPLYFLVMIVFGRPWSWNMLWAIPGFMLLCVFLAIVAVLLALISVRFRDFIQIVQSVIQIVFFVTPIIWHADARPELEWAVYINPFAAMIAAIRDPLMGNPIPMASLIWLIGGIAVMSVISFLVFARYRRRIAYWV